MSNAPHTQFRKGQRVIVHLKSGGKVVARYDQGKSLSLSFLDHAPIPRSAIRQISIYRPQSRKG